MSDTGKLRVVGKLGISKRLFLVLLTATMYCMVGYFYSSNGVIHGDNVFYTILWCELLLFIPKISMALTNFQITGTPEANLEMDMHYIELLVGGAMTLVGVILTLGIIFTTWHVVAGMTLSAIGLYGYRFVAGACIDYARRIFDNK